MCEVMNKTKATRKISVLMHVGDYKRLENKKMKCSSDYAYACRWLENTKALYK